MDEPCSALDPHAGFMIEALIDELKEQYTIVIVTHNMQQAGRVADSTVFMLDGDLVERGPTHDTLVLSEEIERYSDSEPLTMLVVGGAVHIHMASPLAGALPKPSRRSGVGRPISPSAHTPG